MRDHLETLTGAKCPLCGVVIEKGDLTGVIDSEEPQRVRDGRAVWNVDDRRPDGFERFIPARAPGVVPTSDVARRLHDKVVGAARARRREYCVAGTETLVRLGMILARAKDAAAAGDVDAARRAYQVCVDYGSTHEATLAAYHLAEIEEDSGALASAARLYGKAAESTKTELRAIAHLRQGLVLHKLDDKNGAARAYQRSVDCGPSVVLGAAAYRLGLLLHHLGDVPGARKAYRIVVDLRDPQHFATAALNLATFEYDSGQCAEAKHLWTQVIASGDEQERTVAAFNLGQVLEREGRVRKAKKFYRVAAVSPNKEAAERARERLRSLG